MMRLEQEAGKAYRYRRL